MLHYPNHAPYSVRRGFERRSIKMSWFVIPAYELVYDDTVLMTGTRDNLDVICDAMNRAHRVGWYDAVGRLPQPVKVDQP